MYPSPERPALGSFVRDQVEALRRRGDVEVELFAFPPGLRAYPRAARELRRRYGAREPFDVVHAHFGLTAWPALAARLGPVVVTLHGNDLFHPRSNRLTRAVLPLHRAARGRLARVQRAAPRRRHDPPGGRAPGRDRPRPLPRRSRGARRARGWASTPRPYLLFPHDPSRPLKRFDRAREAAGDTTLLTMGRVPPDEVPYWINAANAVLVPSQAEGFGLSVIEALACGVPAFGTPVGIHPVALEGSTGRSARRGSRRRGGRRSGPCSRTTTRAWTAASARRCSPPTAWPPGSSRRGATSWPVAAPTRVRAGSLRVAANGDPILDGSGRTSTVCPC